jgi:hypothetical protein
VASRFLRFNALTEAPRRERLVEVLISRSEGARQVSDWRALAFQVLSPGIEAPSAGGSAYFSAAPQETPRSAAVVTPVHLLAELTQVRLPVGGLMTLSAAEAAALAEDFNRTWRDAGVKFAVRGHNMAMGFEQQLSVESTDPEIIQGHHLDEFLPRGRDAGSIRRLQSEIEMWLHSHPVNEARRARRELKISGLWLWGFGAVPKSLPTESISALGEDPVFSAYEAKPGSVANLLITPASPGEEAWQALASLWLSDAFKDLRAGNIEALYLSAGFKLFEIRRQQLSRFWRRARPWWQYLT